jgi:ATP-binding cassette, subfamily C, bacterial CydC
MKPLRTLRLLLSFLRSFWSQVVLSVLLGVVTVAAGIGLLGTSAYLIAAASLHPSVAALQVAIVGVRFFGICRAVFRYLERLVSHSVNFRLLSGLRVWFYRLLEPLAPARLQDVHSADLLSRAVADIETLENFYVRAVAPPMVALLVILGVGTFVSAYDPRLGGLLAGALLVSGVGLPLLAHALARRPGSAIIERRAALNARLLDAIQGMPDLLAFGQAGTQADRIAGAGMALSCAQELQARAGALVNGLGLLVTGLALWGMLWLAVPLVRAGRISGIDLAVLALVTLASFEAVTPLTQAAQHLGSSLQAARRLFDLVDVPPAAAVPAPLPPAGASPDLLAPKQPLDQNEPGLRIHGLSFAYPGRPGYALSGFDLDLPPGKHVELVGPSGAGKSTLFNLLLRFWNYAEGQIMLNGQELRGCDPQEVRRQMAVIAQTTYLFAGSLRQNLLIARPGAGPEELERVIWQAQLADLVGQLPQGLDTWVGERGLQLSGGERQRLAVARALLRDAPLLLLDEPSANLDAATGQRLLAVLNQASAGRSVIHITHRLGGLEDMDEILVLRSGQVLERGSHTHLLAAGGLYAKMWQVQQNLYD